MGCISCGFAWAEIGCVADVIKNNQEIVVMGADDFVVLCAGSNNCDNQARASVVAGRIVIHISNAVSYLEHTIVILATLHYRYDSCINKKIKTINSVIRKIPKLFNYIKLLKLYFLPHRFYHTSRGAHFNTGG